MLFRDEFYFLSNMYPCEINYNGGTYSCVESAFQAQKDLTRSKEFEGIDGFCAKKKGRHVALRSDWEEMKLQIMTEIITEKFKNPELAAKLKAVTEPIVEDNYWGDTFWGCCNGHGQNHLGKILKQVRENL